MRWTRRPVARCPVERRERRTELRSGVGKVQAFRNLYGFVRPGDVRTQDSDLAGRSMEPAIPDGAYGLFRAPVRGTRQGKTVLVRLRDATDPETGARYTVKRYESEKAADGDSWRHARITLRPNNPEFEPIVLTGADEGRDRGGGGAGGGGRGIVRRRGTWRSRRNARRRRSWRRWSRYRPTAWNPGNPVSGSRARNARCARPRLRRRPHAPALSHLSGSVSAVEQST